MILTETVTASFLITSTIALCFLAYITHEFWLNHVAIREGRTNGLRLETSRMLVALVFTLTATNAIVVLFGIGVLIHFALSGWLLVFIPIFKLYCGIYVVRSLRRQIAIFYKTHPSE